MELNVDHLGKCLLCVHEAGYIIYDLNGKSILLIIIRKFQVISQQKTKVYYSILYQRNFPGATRFTFYLNELFIH